MGEDAEENRRHYEDENLIAPRKVRSLQHEQAEEDRGDAARPEPTQEQDRVL